MISILLALLPIFALILLGAYIKRNDLIAESFWEPAETITYFLFFPALLLHTTATAEMGELNVISMGFILVAATVVVAALTVKSKSLLNINEAEFTSVFQGTIRPNSYVAIAAAFALWQEPGLTLVAICIAIVVPLVNFLSVIVMETYGDQEFRREGGPDYLKLVKSIITNPLILACALGIFLNFTGVGLPPVIDSLSEILGRAALPVGLLCVGAGLSLSALSGLGRGVFFSTTMKLLILPLFVFISCSALGVEGLTRDMAVLYAAMPVSASSYVLARKMGGDAPAMSGIITLTTLVSMATLPLLLLFLQTL